MASKRQLALEPSQPGPRALFFILNSRLVSMLGTALCPSRSTLLFYPLHAAKYIGGLAPLPFGFWLGLASGCPRQEIREREKHEGNLGAGCLQAGCIP